MAPNVRGTQNSHLGLFLKLDFNQYSCVFKGLGKMKQDPTFEDKDENILPLLRSQCPPVLAEHTLPQAPASLPRPGRQYTELRTLARTLASYVHWTRLLTLGFSVHVCHMEPQPSRGSKPEASHKAQGGRSSGLCGSWFHPPDSRCSGQGLSTLCFHSAQNWGCRKELMGFAHWQIPCNVGKEQFRILIKPAQ